MSTVEHINFSSHLSQASPSISSVGFTCLEQTVLNRKLNSWSVLHPLLVKNLTGKKIGTVCN